jgi:protein O-GlcNAc transferase
MVLSNADAVLADATRRLQAGDADGAAARFRQALTTAPEWTDALALLGAAHCLRGEWPAAITATARAIRLSGPPGAWSNRGVALRACGRLTEAADAFRHAAALRPEHREALNNLGVVYHALGREAQAVTAFRCALALSPDYVDARNNLAVVEQGRSDLSAAVEARRNQSGPLVIPCGTGKAFAADMPASAAYDFDRLFDEGTDLIRRGREGEALIAMKRALVVCPDHAESHHNLGIALRRQKKQAAAERSFAAALRLDPFLTASRLSLVDMLRFQRRLVEATGHLHILLAVDPAQADGWPRLGIMLKGRGASAAAVKAYNRAATLNPQDGASRFGAVMALLPAFYDRQEDIALSRAAYTAALDGLPASLRLDTPDGAAMAADAFGSFLPFFLAYQGQSDRDLQRRHGRIASDVLARRHPEFATAPIVPPESRIRVAVVSGFFWKHTIWKLFLRGWMAGFDRRRFQLFGYHTRTTRDDATVAARNGFDRFVEGETNFTELARRIRADRPHVVLFPEIGMDNLTARLAAVRLAPFQCASWGHPDTTGLPTIDVFLSSAFMEPPNAEEHYTEQLVQLPGIGIYYPPLPVIEDPLDLSAYGIGREDVLYLCCQYLSKYLPADDYLIARIAAAVPKARFLFIAPPQKELLDRIRVRLQKAFEQAGVADAERRLTFLPYLSPGRYASLNAQAHVFLDSVGWSGGNTTLEAVAYGLPVVTWPRGLMRGRHSVAILAALGVTGTVADSADAYVEIAARLGHDPDFRKSVREATLRGLPGLYTDMQPIRALEKLLEERVWAGGGKQKAAIKWNQPLSECYKINPVLDMSKFHWATTKPPFGTLMSPKAEE